MKIKESLDDELEKMRERVEQIEAAKKRLVTDWKTEMDAVANANKEEEEKRAKEREF